MVKMEIRIGLGRRPIWRCKQQKTSKKLKRGQQETQTSQYSSYFISLVAFRVSRLAKRPRSADETPAHLPLNPGLHFS